MPESPDILHWKDLPANWQPFPGAIVLGMPNDTYHELPGVSKSGCDLIERSPYRYTKRHGLPTTDSMALGSLRHTLLLEPEAFPKEYHVIPSQMVKNAKHAKYAAELDTAAGRHVVKEKEVIEANILVDAIRDDDVFASYWKDEASDKLCEVSVWWELGPHLLKIRPDLLILPHALEQPLVCFDLKTMVDSSEEEVQRDGERYRKWPKSAAFYSDGIKAAFGRPTDYILLAVESSYPYEVNLWVYGLGDVDMPTVQLGRQQYFANLNTIQACEQTQQWPRSVGPDGIKKMELSRWAVSELAYDD